MSYRIHKGKYYYDLNSVFNKLMKTEGSCFICGSTKELGPHHIKSVKPSKEDYSNESNIVILCRHHHELYHRTYKKVNQKTFAEYVRNQNTDGYKIKNLQNTINQLRKSNKELKKENKKYKAKYTATEKKKENIFKEE